MKQIDIMRTSASRPDFLRVTTESLQKNLKYDGSFRWLIHEDCLDGGKSDNVMRYIKDCGVYTIVERHNPPIGQGPSLGWLLGKVKTKYVINFEDDFELIKEVDVDRLWKLMDNNTDINQIAFHKRPIMSEKPGFKKVHIVRDGVDLVTNPHWAFTPSIFRLSYLKPKWISFNIDVHWKMNEILKGTRGMRDARWVMDNTGTYFLGRWKSKMLLKEYGGDMTPEEYTNVDEGFYAKHIGMGDGSVRLGRYGK